MDPSKIAAIQAHTQAIAALLYEETEQTEPEQLTTLEGIEIAVRGHILEHISPAIAHFLLKQAPLAVQDEPVISTVLWES